jgi:copper(I)-binding protein
VIAAPATTRRMGIGLVAICAALLTSACATGQRAATANVVAAVDAASATVGDLQLHDVAIKPPADGPSYASGDAAELQLVIVNTGHATDTLQSVSSPVLSSYQVFATADEASAAAAPSVPATPSDSTSASGSASGTPTDTASGTPTDSTSASGSTSASASASSSAPRLPTPVSLQVPAGQALSLSVNDTAAVLLIRLNKSLFPGTSVQMTFTFANAGSVTLTVPVQITANSTAGLTILPPSETGAA